MACPAKPTHWHILHPSIPQLLLSACDRGAELDASLVLVKATAEPGVTRHDIYNKLCEEDEELYMCPDCGGWAPLLCGCRWLGLAGRVPAPPGVAPPLGAASPRLPRPLLTAAALRPCLPAWQLPHGPI